MEPRAEKTSKQDMVQAILLFRQYNLTDLMVSEVNEIEEDAMCRLWHVPVGVSE